MDGFITTLGQVVIDADSKVNVVVDPAIVDLARALLPRAWVPNRQRFAPHITVVRDEELTVIPARIPDVVTFMYDPCPVEGEVYWWLRVHSPELVELRRALGLPDGSSMSRPPDGERCFHITIGNKKHRVPG
jgi:2'-5' RNA ligase